jgi:uncharacterized protein YecE (DUF72 family)
MLRGLMPRENPLIHIGTSGWEHEDWRGAFYPPGLAPRERLADYASRFPAVEISASFESLPSRDVFQRWHDETPEGFRFALQASSYITDELRLQDCAQPMKLLWSRAQLLGDKLGPVLFQLPPRFPAKVKLLRSFLETLPEGCLAAFEFLDPSWHKEPILEALNEAGAALVLADRPGLRMEPEVTGGWSYIRFHQGRRDDPGYSADKLRRWSERIWGLAAAETWVFFNNDAGANAPRDAARLAHLLRVPPAVS